jgi:hypothetical protein
MTSAEVCVPDKEHHMNDIQPKFQRLNDMLKGCLFEIPAYQRSYSWEKKQRADLFDDITRLQTVDKSVSHFMATMVGLFREVRRIDTDEFRVIEIVDGQQRLTSLIILFKALLKSLSTTDAKEVKLAAELSALLVKGDDLSILLLQTNHDSCHHFRNYIRGGVDDPDFNAGALARNAKTMSERLLLNAIEECEEFVRSWRGTKLELGHILKNRLTLIFYEMSDESSVYTVFEVLNSRGLDVAWLDRLKSILMGIAFGMGGSNGGPHVKEIRNIWADIYKIIGLHQGLSTEALRFAAILKSPDVVSRVPTPEQSIDIIRTCAKGTAKGAVAISRWILSVVKAVDCVHANPRRKAVTEIVHARLLAVAIELGKFKPDEKDKLRDAWEKVTFRIFGMCRKDARTRVGEYVRLSHRFMTEPVTFGDALSCIRELGGDEYGIEEAVKALADSNCYEGWEEELRYFMMRYEEFLAKEQGHKYTGDQWSRIWHDSAAKSIEHICPKSRGSEKRTRSNRTIFVHRLGNLTLLPPGLNSSLGDKSPTEKADRYRGAGLLLSNQLAPMMKTWGPEAVRKREEKLLKWAQKEWAD